ncbi:hypothetical protein CERZMDRAFT_101881 [Cercospora zeae-maydis SCOH1-5]|uniref:rRNA-processing protein n=1 Tax=Cercospora zeae-maydis SCOH1-5 TaxID=717836 RepID=A0A6A6F1M7_9PEZI|nr:hypothetical protein CERZMDRAFT_101881 [Cercospora zeae-maydis SCOH1-5]
MSATSTSTASAHAPGMRKNGKQWHEPRRAFRPTAGQSSYAKRVARESQAAEVKKRRIQAIKDKRAAKEEKERYEKMAEKMHKKRVERLKRREKRNKLLKS